MIKNRHELELRHAPEVDPTWTEDFILEARLQDVPGRHIGDALAEINSHIVESGRSPYDAFGDPKEYAIALAADAPKVPDGGILPTILPAVLQTLGMLAALNAIKPGLDGEPFDLTVGMLAMLALLAGAFTLLAWQSVALIRLIIDRPWLAIGVHLLFLAALVGLLFIPGVVASLPAWWVVAAGVVLIVAGTVYGLAKERNGAQDDPIEAPSAIDVGGSQGNMRWATLLSNLLIPIFTVILGAVIILL